MIIVKSILATFVVSVIFRGGWGSSKKWLELKIEPTYKQFSLPKSVKRTVVFILVIDQCV
jgi:hypothetical protein